ncbi:MAG TPA: 2-oxo-tetronate isomerase, partial [Anaeromyxobacteraceae bacterium]|nr:2-oxo-tetronate isomerase [Anaeromyxobacteraceae bacterium]
MPQFAANLTMMFNEVPFLERFDAAARAGFEAVEFLFPYEHAPEEVAARLRAAEVRNVLFNMPPGNWAAGERGIGAVPGREQEFREGVAKALRYAEALGTPTLHAMAGLQPAGAERAACRATYLENLRFAARELARRGLVLVIEPINTRDIPGYFLNTQAEAHALREEVGAENLKVQMDLYHAQIVEGDLTAKLRRWAPHVGHVQVASVPERHEPDRGEVSYPHLFRVLDEIGYAGW